MTESFAPKHSIRAQLETEFDAYLSAIANYLRREYADLELPQEFIDELAATVIVRVSHANPEPTSLQAALFAAADEVVTARRPQLSERIGSVEHEEPPISEIPASVPSLRLIARSRRGADLELAGRQGPESFDAVLDSARLMLANPPQDLREALNFRSKKALSEDEPGLTSASESAEREAEQPAPTERLSNAAPAANDTATAASEAAPPSATMDEATVVARHAKAKSKRAASPRKARSTRTSSDTRAMQRSAPQACASPPLSPHFGVTGTQLLPDEIAMVAMSGFPSNPSRAARLCVTALAEELGMPFNADLSLHVDHVVQALEQLAARWTAGGDASQAASDWQRTARKATLEAFLRGRD